MRSWGRKDGFRRLLAVTGAAVLAAGSPGMSESGKQSSSTAVATLGGGCFWCLEAVFERVDGVRSVVSGYAGGTTEHPTYAEVCTGRTGHAEVVQIHYDPAKVSYEALLELFWRAHDPTTRNRQGADVGPQYRSLILYHDEAQRRAAERSRAAAQRRFAAPIVTEIVPLKRFYPAEAHHQDFYRNHRGHGYCRAVITPKLKKLEQETARPRGKTVRPSASPAAPSR